MSNKKIFSIIKNISLVFLLTLLSSSLSIHAMKLTEAIQCTLDQKVAIADILADKTVLKLDNCIATEHCIIFEVKDNAEAKHLLFTLKDANEITQAPLSDDCWLIPDINNDDTYIQFTLTDTDKTVIQKAYENQKKSYFQKNIKKVYSEITKSDESFHLRYDQIGKIIENGKETETDIPISIKIEQEVKTELTRLVSNIQLPDDSESQAVFFTFQQDQQQPPKVMELTVSNGLKQMFPSLPKQKPAADPVEPIAPQESTLKQTFNFLMNKIWNLHSKLKKSSTKLKEPNPAAISAADNIADEIQQISQQQKTFIAADAIKKNLIDTITHYEKEQKKTKEKIVKLNQEIKNKELQIENLQKNALYSEIPMANAANIKALNIEIEKIQTKIEQYDEKQYQSKETVSDDLLAYKQSCATTDEYNDAMKNLQMNIISTIKTLNPKLDFSQLKPKEDVIAQISKSSDDVALFFKNMRVKAHSDKQKNSILSNILEETFKNVENDLRSAIPFYKNKRFLQQKDSAKIWQNALLCTQISLMPTIIHEIGMFVGPEFAHYLSGNKQGKKIITQLQNGIESKKLKTKNILLSTYNKLNKCLQKKPTTQDIDRISKILES